MTRRIILVDIGAGLTLAGILPSVALNAAYNAQLTARGGQPPYTYTLAAGALPSGLFLDPATGIISGTADSAGSAAFTVRATDVSGAFVDRVYTINVLAEPLTLSGAAPAWTVGVAYSYTYTAAHGVPPYVWGISAGALPAGIALNASTGEISGTPTAPNAPAWTVRVTDSVGTTLAIQDNVTLQLLGDFAAATVGSAYSSDIDINGGDLPYSNPRVIVGALPDGLALSIVGGKLRLSGTPTAAATDNFTVVVDSDDGQMAASAQTITISAAPRIVSLLHFDGSESSTIFNDETGKVWTRVGSAAITTLASKFGGASGNFPNGMSTNYVSTPNSADFSFPGAFTFEAWAQQLIIGAFRNFFHCGDSSHPGGLSIYINNGMLGFDRGWSGSLWNDPVAFPNDSAFHHVVVQRDASNTFSIYIDGSLRGTFVNAADLSSTGPIYFGNVPLGRGSIGRIDEARVTKGAALYAANFVPPSTPFSYP